MLQIRAARFNQWIYWFTIIATTTLGTTIADHVDRNLGVGYPGGTTILIVCLLASFALWHKATGTIAVGNTHRIPSLLSATLPGSGNR